MKIVVNDIAASKGGAITVLKQFYNYVKQNDTDNEWFFLLGDKYIDETTNIHVICMPEIKANRMKKVFFDLFTGRKKIGKLHPDVVVSLQNIITFGVHVPQILYVHQSIPFQNIKKYSFFKSSERSLAFVQYIIGAFIKLSIKKADRVFVQTNWMREAVAHKVGIQKNKILLAFPEIEPMKADTSKFMDNRFFYPTAISDYKNNKLIVKACDLLNSDGITDFEVRLTLNEGTITHKNIKCIGKLNRAEMQNEYQKSTLLYPSYIETVGLPLLEARSCQTMVLASDTPFCHECMEYYENVYYFNPFDAIALKEHMKAIIFEKYRIQNVTRHHSNKESWNEFYEEIISCTNYSS